MIRILLVVLFAVMSLGTRATAEVIEFKKFDQNHSTIGFRVPIFGGFSHVQGKFTAFDIQLRYDPDDPLHSFVGATIDATTINTGIDERDTHIRSADFLDTQNYPKIMFVSNRVEAREGGFTAFGKLSMRGVSQEVELPFEITGLHKDPKTGKWTLGIHATAAFNRQDFGVEWRHADPLFVGDSVFVEIDLITRLTAGP
jgi:polyisoprenoid-binding protein YceI